MGAKPQSGYGGGAVNARRPSEGWGRCKFILIVLGELTAASPPAFAGVTSYFAFL
jgi:hypothetical protein